MIPYCFLLWMVPNSHKVPWKKDLESIRKWANQWKVLSNSDSSKQAADVYFSRKHRPIYDLPLIYNTNTVQMCTVQ